MPVAQSILYLLSYVVSFVSIMAFPKGSNRERALTWIPVTFFLLMSFDALVAGVCTLLHIPVGLASQGAGNVILAVTLVLIMRKKGRIQSLSFNRRDAVFLVLFSLVALVVIRMEFGSDFTPHYLVTDPINHFRNSLRILFEGTVSSMYQAWNFIATAIGFASGFVRFDMYYKVYCLCDALFWYFGGLLFYSFAGDLLSGRYKEYIAGIFAILYALGYPLNSLIWGFCYLGVGVSFSVLAAFLTRRALTSSNTLNLACLAISLFGVITSYALFTPFVFLSVFISILQNTIQTKQPPRRFIFILVAVFLIPGLLGSWFFYDGILSSGSVTFAGALENEGGMYRNLYSNLVLFAPLFLVSLWQHIKKRRVFQSPHTLLFSILVVAFAILLIPTYTHTLSTYYLGKIQFVIWPFALLLSAEGSEEIINLPGKALLASYAAVLAFLGIMVVGEVDQKITEAYRPIGVGTPGGYHPYLDLYSWNLTQMRYSGAISSDVWDLCHEASNYVETGKEVPIIAAYMYTGWYYDITCQIDEIRRIRSTSTEWRQAVTMAIDGGYDYLTVITLDYGNQGNDGAAEASEYLLSLEGANLVYQNSAGYILHLEN